MRVRVYGKWGIAVYIVARLVGCAVWLVTLCMAVAKVAGWISVTWGFVILPVAVWLLVCLVAALTWGAIIVWAVYREK